MFKGLVRHLVSCERALIACRWCDRDSERHVDFLIFLSESFLANQLFVYIVTIIYIIIVMIYIFLCYFHDSKKILVLDDKLRITCSIQGNHLSLDPI